MIHLLTLSWNAEDKLKALKESLLPALQNVDYFWYIKDNGSKDNTVETVKSWGGNINVIPYKNNTENFSVGMNYLFNIAAPKDNDYILLLNNDVIFNDKTSIKKMIKIMEADKDVGIVGARLLYTGSDKLQHAGVVIDNKHKMPMHYRANQASDKAAEKNREFQAITAAVALTKAQYYKNICKTNKSGNQGLDENFIWCFEDVSACFSIKYNMEKKIVYCGDTNISHEESATLKKIPSNKLFMPHNTNYFLKLWKDRYILDHDYYKAATNYKIYEK